MEWKDSELKQLSRVSGLQALISLSETQLLMVYYNELRWFVNDLWTKTYVSVEPENHRAKREALHTSESTVQIISETALHTIELFDRLVVSKRVIYCKGEFERWHKWQYPVKTQDAWYCRTQKNRKEWLTILSKEFLFLLPELWQIVDTYDLT